MSQTFVKNSMACQSDKEGRSVVGTQQFEDILSPNAQKGCIQALRMINISHIINIFMHNRTAYLISLLISLCTGINNHYVIVP